MKFYSEVTGDLYDDISALEEAEAKVKKEDEDAKFFEILELIDEMAAKQATMNTLAKRVAELTNESFTIPSITAYPDGAVEIHAARETITVDKVGKVSTDAKEDSILDEDIKNNLNEIFDYVTSKDKCVHHCDADCDCDSKKKTKKIDDDIATLLDVLNSLRSF